MEGDDVFGIISYTTTGRSEVMILKSKDRIKCIEDGMDDEEFEEHWSYNIEGSKGRYSYSVVDDEITLEEIEELVDEDEDEDGNIINPPYSD